MTPSATASPATASPATANPATAAPAAGTAGVELSVVVPMYRESANAEAAVEAISRHVAPGAHAVLVLDGVGWHGLAALGEIPRNLTLLPLPPYSPELNPIEKGLPRNL